MLPLLSPALVVYLALDLAAQRTLDAAGWTLVALACLLSLVPMLAARQGEDLPGARRIAWLGLASACALIGAAAPDTLTLASELARVVPLPAIGGLAADLALDVPDRPAAIARRPVLRTLVRVAAVVAALIGVASVLAPLPFLPDVVVPLSVARLVPVTTLVLMGAALALRGMRRRLGSAPEALAANAGAAAGTFASLVLLGLVAVLSIAGWSQTAVALRALAAAGVVVLVLGQLSIRGELRPTGAALATRRAVTAFVALGLVGVGAAQLVGRVPGDAVGLGMVASAVVTVAVVMAIGLRRAVERVFAPDGGRLLAAVTQAEAAVSGARDLVELGAAVLPPLRAAARLPDAEPLVYAIDPPRVVRIDAASLAHVEARPLSPAVIERLTARVGESVLRAPLEALVVRRPDLRGVVESLEALDAAAVVPLIVQGEVEGALVVPRGLRRAALTLEEIAALEGLARRLAPVVSLLSAQERAQRRVGELLAGQEKLEDRVDALEDELSRARTEAARAKEGAGGPSATPLVAYGPAMRKTVARVEEVAAIDAPVLFVAEPGVYLAPLVRRLHEASPRKMGPIVIADCANVRPEDAEIALFGDDLRAGTPGWLRLAAGGTLFLDRATALGVDVLRALDEAIATRTARTALGGTPYTLEVRVVVGVHDDPSALLERSSIDAGLAERLRPLRIDVPPLRERTEDLGSLVLFAIDRACRAAGAPTLGIDADAMAELSAHGWPGNEVELFALVERAVRRATPPRITKADVGPLVVREPETHGDPLAGSLAEIERRALETALARAGGNKSEAARLLGVARTTFLDKLKRAGLEVPDERKSVRPAAPKPADKPVEKAADKKGRGRVA